MPADISPYLAAIAEARRDAERAQLTVDAIAIQTVRFARMVAEQSGEKISLRDLAGVLGISKSQVARLLDTRAADVLRDSEGEWPHGLAESVAAVWHKTLPGMQGWVGGSPGVSQTLMRAHGIAKDQRLNLATPDTSAYEAQELISGTRWLLYSQTRWDGFRSATGEPDHRGEYILVQCPGLSDGCWIGHEAINLDQLDLEPVDLTYGSGWPGGRPGDSEVFERLRNKIIERTGALDVDFVRTVVFG